MGVPRICSISASSRGPTEGARLQHGLEYRGQDILTLMSLLLSLVALLAADSVRLPRDTTRHNHRVSVEGGYGYETWMWRVGTQHDFRRRRFGSAASPWVGGVFVEVTAGAWYGRSRAGENRNLIDIAATPVWQLSLDRGGLIEPYMEAAVGFHHLSEVRINRRVGFGTAFQFGDHAGIGLRFGAKRSYDLTFRFQHLSNGGIRRPNRGINFSSLRFSRKI